MAEDIARSARAGATAAGWWWSRPQWNFKQYQCVRAKTKSNRARQQKITQREPNLTVK